MDILSYNEETVEIEHHKIHEGVHYNCQDYDSDVDIASRKYWRITTPDTIVRVHFNFRCRSSFPGTVELFENPTVSAAGTALIEYNNDRNSSNTTTVTCFKDTTTSADGTRIGVNVMGTDETAPGVGAGSTDGGILERREEIILKQNEDYIIKFTSGIDNARVSICVSWYEK